MTNNKERDKMYQMKIGELYTMHSLGMISFLQLRDAIRVLNDDLRGAR